MGFMQLMKAAPLGVGGLVAKEVFGKKKSEPSAAAGRPQVQQPQSPLGVQAPQGQAPLGIAKNGNLAGALQSTQGGKSYLGQ